MDNGSVSQLSVGNSLSPPSPFNPCEPLQKNCVTVRSSETYTAKCSQPTRVYFLLFIIVSLFNHSSCSCRRAWPVIFFSSRSLDVSSLPFRRKTSRSSLGTVAPAKWFMGARFTHRNEQRPLLPPYWLTLKGPVHLPRKTRNKTKKREKEERIPLLSCTYTQTKCFSKQPHGPVNLDPYTFMSRSRGNMLNRTTHPLQ